MPTTQQELIEVLEDLAIELGETPTIEDMNEQGSFSATTYYNHFESWNAALERANLQTQRESNVTREDLVEDLTHIDSQIDQGPPVADDIREHTEYSLTTYYSEFDGLNEAREAADLKAEASDRVSRDKIISEIQQLADGEIPPTTDEMNELGSISARTCIDRFGSWNDALQAAGFEPHKDADEATKDDLLNEIKRLHEELGRSPSTGDMRDYGKYPPSRYFDNFESWNAAVSKAGFSPNEQVMDPKEQQIPPSELLAELRRVGDLVDGRPTCEDMIEYGKYSPVPYRNRFDSWNQAVELAGYSAFTGTSEDIYSTDELVTELRRVADKLGRPPTTDNMERHGEISTGPYLLRFESWIDALREAGLEPTEHQLRGTNHSSRSRR